MEQPKYREIFEFNLRQISKWHKVLSAKGSLKGRNGCSIQPTIHKALWEMLDSSNITSQSALQFTLLFSQLVKQSPNGLNLLPKIKC